MIKKFLQKIFKIVSYGILSKVYGKIKKSVDISEDDRVKVKIVNIEKDLNYKVYNVTNGRLYTDRIQDTAILLDDKIIEQPSFQLRHTHDSKIYNSNIRNNIVFKKGTPRKLINLNGTVLSLLIGGDGNDKYWHGLIEVLRAPYIPKKSYNTEFPVYLSTQFNTNKNYNSVIKPAKLKYNESDKVLKKRIKKVCFSRKKKTLRARG